MNLPNKLSMLRIILVPVFMFFYLATFIPGGKLIALIVFAAAALTDMLDGRIARKNNLVTDLGKLLDPIADKLLVLGGLLLLIADNTIPMRLGAIYGIIILGRDQVVSGLRGIAASKGVVIAADIYGKLKAICIDIAIPMLIFVSYNNDAGLIAGFGKTMFNFTSFLILTLGTILTIISCTVYIYNNRHVIKEK